MENKQKMVVSYTLGKKRQETKNENMTIGGSTIATNENCPCRKEKGKCKKYQK